VSGVTGGPFAGTAARRRRALAHLSPIFDLHLNRSRNPSEVAWSAYDFIALTQLTVDAVALSSGLDGNLGIPRPAVLAEMTRAAAAMAPGRPANEHTHVAHVLDHNGRRPHLSRELRPPRPDHPVADLSRERIKRRPVFGGFLNDTSGPRRSPGQDRWPSSGTPQARVELDCERLMPDKPPVAAGSR
jgi:hypothetical protein